MNITRDDIKTIQSRETHADHYSNCCKLSTSRIWNSWSDAVVLTWWSCCASLSLLSLLNLSLCVVMQSFLKKWRTPSLTGTEPWQPCQNISPNWPTVQRPNAPNTATNHQQKSPLMSLHALTNVMCCSFQHETRKTVLQSSTKTFKIKKCEKWVYHTSLVFVVFFFFFFFWASFWYENLQLHSLSYWIYERHGNHFIHANL